MMASLQFWLQGWPNKPRPWISVLLGNLISDVRYWTWRISGNRWDDELVVVWEEEDQP